jgi:hypothetical protein
VNDVKIARLREPCRTVFFIARDCNHASFRRLRRQ